MLGVWLLAAERSNVVAAVAVTAVVFGMLISAVVSGNGPDLQVTSLLIAEGAIAVGFQIAAVATVVLATAAMFSSTCELRQAHIARSEALDCGARRDCGTSCWHYSCDIGGYFLSTGEPQQARFVCIFARYCGATITDVLMKLVVGFKDFFTVLAARPATSSY